MVKTWVDIARFNTHTRTANSCNFSLQEKNPCDTDFNRRLASAEIGNNNRHLCVSVCYDEGPHSASGSNPCVWNAPVKATNRRYIHPHWGFTGIPAYGLECEWNVDDAMLRKMSGDQRYRGANVKSSDGTVLDIWQQLLFGIRIGKENTESQGYCRNVNHLLKQVHSNGDTCYDLIKEKNNGSTAQRKGVDYCKKHPTSPWCKCINISQPGGVTYCLQNPTLPGCSKVADTFKGIPEKARTQFNLQNQSTGCFNGTACAGSGFFLPEAVPAVCNNTITVCEQTVEVGDITGGSVNIEQAMECGSEGDVDKDGNPIDDRPPPPASFEDFKTNPLAYFNPGKVTSDKRAAAGTGGVTFLTSCMCCLCILLMIMVLGGGGGRKAGARFKR